MVKLTEIADQAAVKLDAVAKGAEKALEWGKRKGAAAEPHLPNAADVKDWLARLRTHNQNRTVAARAIADMKTFGHLS